MKKRIYAFISVTAIILAAVTVFIAVNELRAEDPSNLVVTIYATDLMTDASGAPVRIFTSTSGQVSDLVTSPGDIFGQGNVPAGTYKRLRFTMKNEVSFSGPDPCNSGNSITQTFLIDEAQPADAQVELYFATADDGGGTGWTNDGSAQSPFLIQAPVVVEQSTTTIVKIIFNTADTLRCDWNATPSPTAELLPPTVSMLDYIEGPPTCDIGGDFWFIHYNISSSPYDQNGNLIQNPALNDIFRNTMAIAGWGTVNFNSSNSTWQVDMATRYENGGMAEHRHNLDSWDTNDTADEGYVNPSDPSATGATVGNYTMVGNRIFMFFPGGGFIEGAVTSDCETLIGVHMSDIRETDLVYGVRKPASPPGQLSGMYIFVSPHFDIRFDEGQAAPYPMSGLSSHTNVHIMDADATSGTTSVEWRTLTDVNAVYDSNGLITGWQTYGPSERVSTDTIPISDFVTVNSDGSLTVCSENPGCNPSPDPFFGAVNSSGNGIAGGQPSEHDPSNPSNHYIGAGFVLKVAQNPGLADMEGQWFMAAVDQEVYDQDSSWGSGNEGVRYGLTYGDVDVSGCGTSSCTISWTFTYKDSFSGEVGSDAGTGSIELVQECFGEGLSLDDSTCNGGLKIPVFKVWSNTDNAYVGRLAVDETRSVAVIWTPLDTNDKPENSVAGCPAPSYSPCYEGSPNLTSGVLVKLQ